MLAVLAFMRSPIGKYVALALALGAIALGLMHIGAQGVRKADAKRETAARADLAKHEAVAAEISTKARSDLSEHHALIATHFAHLSARIKTDVTTKDDAACRVPDGFIELWNDAAGDGAEVAGRPSGFEKHAADALGAP